MLIAHKSTAEDIGFLRKLFHEYDTDNSGALDFEEFKQAMSSFGYSDEEVEIMFDAAVRCFVEETFAITKIRWAHIGFLRQDLDGTGMIAYTEFLAATIEAQGSISEERLAEAFDRLDSNDSGYIEPENLVEMLGDDFPREEIEAIIKEADLTHDNRISYAEFLALWENKEDSMNALDVVDRANFIQHKHSSGRKSIMYQDIKTDLDAFIRQESPGIFPQTLQADV
jgi:Ca2+-binding EF-hand superfamily protein